MTLRPNAKTTAIPVHDLHLCGTSVDKGKQVTTHRILAHHVSNLCIQPVIRQPHVHWLAVDKDPDQIHTQSPNVRVQSLPSSQSELNVWQTGAFM